MLEHRRWALLDGADYGWLRAKYHFAVSAQGNAAHRALGPLIVWNDDEIAVGRGFAMHGHRDMEIVTYVRQGVLGHRDTLGSEGTIRAGDVQVMSAGTGIRHAEVNQGDEPLKVYQIWLRPREAGANRHGTRSRFRRTTAPGASSCSRAAFPATQARCRSRRTHVCSARRWRRASACATRCRYRIARISWSPRDASR